MTRGTRAHRREACEARIHEAADEARPIHRHVLTGFLSGRLRRRGLATTPPKASKRAQRRRLVRVQTRKGLPSARAALPRKPLQRDSRRAYAEARWEDFRAPRGSRRA